MTTKQMKEIYEANPDEWIALWSTAIGWINHGKWCKSRNPAFIIENHYKLISIKHKDILEAYLADNSVGIEYEFDEETHHNAGWYKVHYFIENYNPDLEYRLKEKEDVKTLSKQSSQSISSELSDSSNTSDIGLPNINKRQGKGGWRLPKIEELLSIVDYTKHNPASGIDITSNFYWSSTTTASYTSSAWGVYFGVGYSGYHSKTSIMYVHCIRDTDNGLEWGKDAPTTMTWHEAMEYAESLNV